MKLKDKKITIYKQTREDPKGFSRPTLEAITDATLWAYFRHLSGSEVFAAANTNYKEEVLFQVNHRNDITTSCVVEYGGTLYDITRIDSFEGYNTDLTLYCRRRSRQ